MLKFLHANYDKNKNLSTLMNKTSSNFQTHRNSFVPSNIPSLNEDVNHINLPNIGPKTTTNFKGHKNKNTLMIPARIHSFGDKNFINSNSGETIQK